MIIDDVEPEVMRELLLYMYTGMYYIVFFYFFFVCWKLVLIKMSCLYIEGKKCNLGSAPNLDSMSQVLIAAAEKYDLERLKVREI